ncbi:unnamed protein product [Penicillium discolor]
MAEAVGESLEQRRSVLHDVLAPQRVAVDEPARELQLGEQTRADLEPGIGSAVHGTGVGAVHVGRRVGSRGQPGEIECRITDRETVPADHAGDLGAALGVVVEEEGRRLRAAEHDGRLEAPEVVVGDGVPPPHSEAGRDASGGGRGVDKPLQFGAALLGAAHHEPGAADDRRRQPHGTRTVGEGAQRQGLRRQLPRRVIVVSHADREFPAVGERGDGGVEAPVAVRGERPGARDLRAGKCGRHRRG